MDCGNPGPVHCGGDDSEGAGEEVWVGENTPEGVGVEVRDTAVVFDRHVTTVAPCPGVEPGVHPFGVYCPGKL